MKLKTVIPFEYDEIHYLDNNTYSVILNNETAIIDLNGDILIPFHKDLYQLAQKALTIINPLQNSVPFVSYSSRVTSDLFIPHHFFFLRDNSWIVLQEQCRNGFYGIIDHLGNVVVPFEYKSVNIFSNGTIRVNDTNGHSFLFDYYGKQLLPGTYKNIFKIGDYFIVYSKDNMKYGVMDMNGKPLLPFEFDEINTSDLPYSFIIPQKGGVDIGVFCVEGEWKSLYTGLDAMIFPLQDSLPQSPHLYIRQEDRHWLADYNGNMLMLSEMYYDVYGCNGLIQVSRPESFNGYIPVCTNSKSGIINFSGESVIPLKYDQIIVFGNSNTVRYFPVRINDLWGLIDEKNNMIIEPVFSEMLACYNGTIPVRKGDKWGLIQPSGKLILDCVYDVIGVRRDRIRRDFEYYSQSHVLAGKVIPVALNRHDCFALVDLNGCFLSGMEFDKVLPYNSFHKDRLLISRNGKWGVIQIIDSD